MDAHCEDFSSELNNNRGEERVWRRFRVSAGIKIQTLQDKVITPIMGWRVPRVRLIKPFLLILVWLRSRNLHCYIFTDLRDGSLFGPEVLFSPQTIQKAFLMGYVEIYCIRPCVRWTCGCQLSSEHRCTHNPCARWDMTGFPTTSAFIPSSNFLYLHDHFVQVSACPYVC